MRKKKEHIPTKIQIDFNVPIEKWASENKSMIMDSIYQNVFEFMESDEDDRIVLQVQPKVEQERTMRKLVEDEAPIKVDFIISKDDIDLTLKKLLEHMIEVEEYEKCAEIVKLQNREEPPKPKKRGRPKKVKE